MAAPTPSPTGVGPDRRDPRHHGRHQHHRRDHGVLDGTDTATISITAVNDAPVATITPASYSATEQTSLNLKNTGLSVSDVDSLGGVEKLTLSVAEGTLTVTAGTSGAAVSGSGTSSVTITGTLAQINALLSTDGASTVSYIDSTDTPTASATLTLSVNDKGNSGTGGADRQRHGDHQHHGGERCAGGDDHAGELQRDRAGQPEPEEHRACRSATSTAVAGSRSDAVGCRRHADGDGRHQRATVVGSGTHSVTITGTMAQINALLNTDGTSTVSYIDSTDTPCGERDADAVDQRQWQHRHRRDADRQRHGDDQHHGGRTTRRWRRSRRRATRRPSRSALNLKNTGMSVSDVDAWRCRDRDAVGHRGHADGDGRHQRCGGRRQRHVSVTITGTLAQINALLNTDGTSTVSYIDGTDTPCGSATLTLSINDMATPAPAGR